MTILVTRPQPDNETTGASLRARGFDVLLAPMLRFEPVALLEDEDADYAAIIVTSANALRAIEPQLPGHRWLKLPLLAVGDRTAAAARRAGFSKIISAGVDAVRAAGVEISALAVPQCCISANVATVLREAGASRVALASSPDENSLFVAVDRALAGRMA